MTDLEGERAELPLIPARMLNEFVYCPRLFHLEWVDGRWAHNDDTAEGAFVHRRVDSRSGPMPPPTAEEPPQTTHSVQLSSQKLGITATIDRVDHSDGTCTPVDYKKGHPQSDGRAWPADVVQLWAQSALLEDAGYVVREGQVSYAQTHSRVAVPWNLKTRQELLAVIRQAGVQARAVLPPPPLVDSPKCPRCSLVGLCLPDETSALMSPEPPPVRRIMARDPEQRPLYVTEPGSRVSLSGGRIKVTKDEVVLSDSRLIDVSHICLFGNAQVSTQAMTKMLQADIRVLYLSSGGWLNGWAQGSTGNYVHLRRRQVVAHSQSSPIANRIVAGKIRNQRVLLRRNSREKTGAPVIASLKRLADQAESATSLESLLGIEGTAARLYFGNFSRMLTHEEFASQFDANGRARRPPPDPVNALLGFCYSMLTKELVVACTAVGLDPQLGVLHRPRFGRPSMALDLAEEFRALIADSVVLQVVNNGEIGPSDFIRRSIGVQLTPTGRRKVLAAFERRLDTEVVHPTFRYRISYRRVMDLQTRIMAAAIVGELPQYTPMVTR